MKRLQEIKEIIATQENESYRVNEINSLDMQWLIEQAELLAEISDTWVAIETNGSTEEADNFYTIVQDILTPEQD